MPARPQGAALPPSRAASLEITANGSSLAPALVGRLAGWQHALRRPHAERAKLADVAETACAVERAVSRPPALRVARRIASRREPDAGPRATSEGGVARVAARSPATRRRPRASTLEHTPTRPGCACAAESASSRSASRSQSGRAIRTSRPPRSGDALARKQAYGALTGATVHVVSQFGFGPAALVARGPRTHEPRHRPARPRRRRRPGFARSAREVRDDAV